MIGSGSQCLAGELLTAGARWPARRHRLVARSAALAAATAIASDFGTASRPTRGARPLAVGAHGIPQDGDQVIPQVLAVLLV